MPSWKEKIIRPVELRNIERFHDLKDTKRMSKHSPRPALGPALCLYSHMVEARENEGTERYIQGVGWDMSMPFKLFLVLGGNGSLFPLMSA